MRSELLNGGAFCRTARALGNTTDETETDGAWVAREGDEGIAMSGKLSINYSAVLVDGGTLTAAVTVQDASDADGTGVADYDEVASTTIDTANSGGETVSGTIEVDVDFAGAKLFVRPQITLVASGGGTVAYSAEWVLFGDQVQPSSNAIASLGGANNV